MRLLCNAGNTVSIARELGVALSWEAKGPRGGSSYLTRGGKPSVEGSQTSLSETMVWGGGRGGETVPGENPTHATELHKVPKREGTERHQRCQRFYSLGAQKTGNQGMQAASCARLLNVMGKTGRRSLQALGGKSGTLKS